MLISSGSDRATGRFDLAGNDFLRGVFASTAAIGHWQIALNFRQGASTPVHDFADLTIADAIAETDVHAFAQNQCGRTLNGNANDCQLTGALRI